MNAVERGMQLIQVPIRDLPPVALDYARFLASQVGLCMEVCLTAYTVYAQLVEKLPCDDPLYIPTEEARYWFSLRTQTTEGP